MDTQVKRLNTVIRDIRQSFHVLKDVADDLHSDIDVNASMRSVMESLAGEKKRTVPDIARSKDVSRQHIQLIMNRLQEKGLVANHENPKDKRTSFFSLTKNGVEKYARILRRETDFLSDISKLFTPEELRITTQTIRKLTGIIKENDD